MNSFDDLLRNIECTDRPSVAFMKAIANDPGMIGRAGGRCDRSLLHHAAAHKKLDTVKYLCLKCSADINVSDRDGDTPLDYALTVQAVDVADYLRSIGAKTRSERHGTTSGIQVETKTDSLVAQSRATTALGPRFIDNGDGTVQDTQTGLIWMRFAEGQTWSLNGCSGQTRDYQWHGAKGQRRTYSGSDDWRLPSIEELKTIVEKDRENPSIDLAVFPATPSHGFWSSSGYRGVNFKNGREEAYYPGERLCVRLVRGGQNLHVATSVTGLGTVTISPEQSAYAFGSTVLLSAEPQIGFVFNGWAGDVNGNDSTCSLIMDRNKQVTATFEEKAFALRLEQAGTGSGVVRRSSTHAIGDVDSPQGYLAGTSVTLTATPDLNSVFAGWIGDATGSETSISILMDAEKSVAANFLIKSFDLNVACDGTGSGVIECAPKGGNYWFPKRLTLRVIECAPKGGNYPIGTEVTLVAIPGPGSVFSGWSGDTAEKEPTCTVVMNSPKAVTASFSRLSYALDVTTTGSGKGAIKRSQESEDYAYGDLVTLVACAEEGSIFNGWGGSAAGLDATCTVSMDSARSVTAEFVRLDIPTREIGLAFDSARQISTKSGGNGYAICLSIANKGQEPMALS